MDVSIVGAGHVGLVSGACFAELGHRVIMVDNDQKKLEKLTKGKVWFYEPGLEELVQKGLKAGRLSFTDSIKHAVDNTQVIFISVNTPPKPDGGADLSFVEQVSKEIANAMTDYRLIVEKSTVPVQTGERVKRTLNLILGGRVPFDVASNPEFLREGTAVEDTLKPDRIVIGAESERAKQLLTELYKPIKSPVLVTDVKSAELIKHASNSFLALKISFINAVARICDLVGADVNLVADGMGLDARIGRAFLYAGVGYGGSCFPKDVSAFISISKEMGYDFELLKAVPKINSEQRELFVSRMREALWNLKGKRIAVLGLAFKPDTDDLREAPAIGIIKMLQAEHAEIRTYDPQAMEAARGVLEGVTFCDDPYQAAEDADCLALVTEWDAFKNLDLARLKKIMKHPIIIDGRNAFQPEAAEKAGFHYMGIGIGKTRID